MGVAITRSIIPHLSYIEKKNFNIGVINIVRVYTDEWNSFQFIAPRYLDGHFDPYKFDLVKWVNCNPHEVIDLYTGKNKISTRYCFTVATLILDKREQWFRFESCGLRYLEYRIDGLEKFILDFCKMMERELNKGEERIK